MNCPTFENLYTNRLVSSISFQVAHQHNHSLAPVSRITARIQGLPCYTFNKNSVPRLFSQQTFIPMLQAHALSNDHNAEESRNSFMIWCLTLAHCVIGSSSFPIRCLHTYTLTDSHNSAFLHRHSGLTTTQNCPLSKWCMSRERGI